MRVSGPSRPLVRFGAAVAAVLWLAPSSARAAIPPLSPEELEERSAHIVVGRVTEIYSTVKVKGEAMSDTLYAIEVAVEHVEKGEGVRVGQVVYARAWRPHERPRGWAGPQGQNELPKPGAFVRLHVRAGEDGGLDVLAPNGLAVLEPMKLAGKLVKRPWTKSLESYRAGGGEYCVVEVEGGAVEVVQPSTAVAFAALAAHDGQAVELEGIPVRGRVPPAADDSQRPIPAPAAPAGEPVRQGGGFLVLAAKRGG